jgi:hypothetical protein
MADPVQIQGSSYQGKIRNPLGVIGLSIITLGIYYVVWYFKINKEMAEVGQARGSTEAGDNPTTSLLAYFPGMFILVPPFVSTFKACKRLNAAERLTGLPQGMEGPLLWLLLIFIGPVGQYILQSNLNKVLQAQAGGGATLPPSAAMPQPTGAPEAPTAPPAPEAPPPPPPSSG